MRRRRPRAHGDGAGRQPARRRTGRGAGRARATREARARSKESMKKQVRGTGYEEPFKTGTVAIVGRPNVGKSTLLNELVGAHVAITSRKPQTTRHRLLGIHTDERMQAMFVDTPGFQTEHRTALNREMNRTVGQVIGEVDAIVFVVDAYGWHERDDPVLALLPPGVPVILALNKLDKMKDRSLVAATLADAAKRR